MFEQSKKEKKLLCGLECKKQHPTTKFIKYGKKGMPMSGKCYCEMSEQCSKTSDVLDYDVYLVWNPRLLKSVSKFSNISKI